MIDNLTGDWAAARRGREVAVTTAVAAVPVRMPRRVMLFCALRFFIFSSRGRNSRSPLVAELARCNTQTGSPTSRGRRIALRHQRFNPPRLRDNLLGRVSLRWHRQILRSAKRFASGRIAFQGLHKLRNDTGCKLRPGQPGRQHSHVNPRQDLKTVINTAEEVKLRPIAEDRACLGQAHLVSKPYWNGGGTPGQTESGRQGGEPPGDWTPARDPEY